MVEAQTSPKTDGKSDVLLEVNNLKMYFPVTSGIIMQRTVAEIKAVDDVSFFIRKGETLGLVGESGCGKTTTGRCILRLYEPTGGQVTYDGKNLQEMGTGEMRRMRPCGCFLKASNISSQILSSVSLLWRGEQRYLIVKQIPVS